MATNPNMLFRCQVLLSATIGLVLLVLPGCRGASSVQVDVLEQELRQQEDYIYELEDYLVEYSEKLRQARRKNCQKTVQAKSSAKPARSENLLDDEDFDEDFIDDQLTGEQQPEETPKGAAPAPLQAETGEIPEPAASKQMPEPADTEPPSPPNDLDDLEIPELNIEKPSASRPNRQSLPWSITDTEILTSSAEKSVTPGGPLGIPDPVNYRQPRPASRHEHPDADMEQVSEDAYEFNPLETEIPSANKLAAEGSSHDAILETDGTSAIDRIVIQQLLQNSSDEKQSPEQAGALSSSPRSTIPPGNLLAVVEIRDLANEPVDAEGELSLMVMAVSPSQAGPAGLQQGKPRRLQRWDFSAEDVHDAWQSSPLGDGLHLELPWAAKQRSNDSLELWARLVTADGQKYLTKLPFNPQHLVALRDALSVNPGYDRPENQTSPPTGGATRLVDRTMQEGTAQWHTARIQSLRPETSLQPGTLTSHHGTRPEEPPRWVTQTGSSRERARHSGISLAPEAATVVPRIAAREQPDGGSPTWKSTLR